MNTTLDNLQSTARIVILGCCGGYHNLATVLEKAPEAHIISSKQVGTRWVNEPIIRSLEDLIRAGKNVDWVNMWAGLGKPIRGGTGQQTAVRRLRAAAQELWAPSSLKPTAR